MSRNGKLLVIIGITGLQGSSVYNEFRNEPGWRIRGITRNPSKHEHFKADNVELVAADLDDEESLKKAFEGADAIFSVTDFFQFVRDPSTSERAAQEGKEPGDIAMKREIEQGKNVVRAAASQLITLERLVVSYLSDAHKWSNGEIMHNYHFDGKAQYVDYLKQKHPALAAKSNYLQVGYYTSNWKTFSAWTPRKQDDGSFVFPIYAPPGGEPMPYVDPAKDTGKFVKALILDNPAGVSMHGYSEALSNDDYCEIWGRVHGVKCTPEYLSFQKAMDAGMPEWLAREISETGIYVSKYGQCGGDPEVKGPKELGVDVSRLTTAEEAIRADDWSAVL